MFSPHIDHTIAFIGFVQPASGGVLSMSEMQARWWAEVCRKRVYLPEPQRMLIDIALEKVSDLSDNFFFLRIVNVTLFLCCARAAQGARALLPLWSTHHSARSNSVLRRGWRDDWLQADIPGKPQPLVEVRVNTRCYPSLSSAIAVEFSGCRLLLGSCGTIIHETMLRSNGLSMSLRERSARSRSIESSSLLSKMASACWKPL